MSWKGEWKALAAIAAVFVGSYYLPVGAARFDSAISEALQLVRWYAREHVITCLIPAFFIAGAISVFIRQSSVIRYLGAGANKIVAYGVASVSGTVLAVCSCTVLPLFAGINRRGAGLGPATTFLYSGPAINVLAIVLTARVLGLQLGVARAVGAVVFSIVIGLLMHVIFRERPEEPTGRNAVSAGDGAEERMWRDVSFVAVLVAILVFANLGHPSGSAGIWGAIHAARWAITGALAAVLGVMLVLWRGIGWWKVAVSAVPAAVLAIAAPGSPALVFGTGVVGLSVVASTSRGETGDWFESSWGYAKQILPLLFAGVLVAGALLGRPGEEGLVPSHWVVRLTGGNSIGANLFASVVGAFMYFATLTEIPILQGLIGNGMGQGPALALLLAGPALSLPNMLVIRSVIGTKRTTVFVMLVVVMATVSGLIYGGIVGREV